MCCTRANVWLFVLSCMHKLLGCGVTSCLTCGMHGMHGVYGLYGVRGGETSRGDGRMREGFGGVRRRERASCGRVVRPARGRECSGCMGAAGVVGLERFVYRASRRWRGY